MQTDHALVEHWNRDFQEADLAAWVHQMRERFEKPVSLGLIFISPAYFEVAPEILEIVRTHAAVPLLVGCSSQWLIAGGSEIEEDAGIVLSLYSLPGAELESRHLSRDDSEADLAAHELTHLLGATPSTLNGLLLFANPLGFDGEGWLRQWNRACPEIPLVGGLASSGFPPRKTQVYLNGDVFEHGAVAISVSGGVTMECVVSQGCTPIGEPWPITRIEENVLQEIGNRPAFKVLAETFENLDGADQQKTRNNLFVGLVLNEYQEEFDRGDFLVRNIMGGDPSTGTLAIGAFPRVGQTMQFQRRDREAAQEDLGELLARAKNRLAGRSIYAGLLCCCNGRGTGLFGRPNNDASMIQKEFGELGIAGFFCNGEFGPVGNQTFLHGYTASLALFVSEESTELTNAS
jgi:small ligand-binding sensory domain FIST